MIFRGGDQSSRRATQLVLVALASLLGCLLCAASGFAWTAPKQLNRGGVKVLRVSGDAGRRGYAVMGWSQIADRAPLVQRNVFGFVRVKKAGGRRFGRVRSLGRVSVGPVVSVGDRGHTLVTWSRLDGTQMTMVRGPGSRWSKPRRVPGRSPGGAVAEVGADGTMALFSSGARRVFDPRAKAVVAVKMPGAKRFGRWRKVSRDPLSVGFEGDLVVGTRGRATVVWAGPCPLGDGSRNAMWVDIRGAHASRPREIPHSKCPAYDLDLERDRAGYQYLKLSGSQYLWLGVQFGVRRPGRPFPGLKFLSPFGQLTAGGQMTVGRRGRVFIAWDSFDEDQAPLARNFVAYRRDRKIAGPGAIKGARIERSGRMDRLQGMGFLPDGSLSTIWSQQWRVGTSLYERFRLTPKIMNPLEPRINHRYKINLPHKTEGFAPVQMKTAADGSRLVWWSLSHLGYIRRIIWIQARPPKVR